MRMLGKETGSADQTLEQTYKVEYFSKKEGYWQDEQTKEVRFFKDGNKYEGQFINGIINGYGALTQPTGLIYEG